MLAKYGQAYKIKHRINNKAISEQTNDIDDVEDEVSDENWSMSENSDVVLMRDSDIDKDSITDFNFTNDVIGFVDDYVIDEWNDYDEDYTINTKNNDQVVRNRVYNSSSSSSSSNNYILSTNNNNNINSTMDFNVVVGDNNNNNDVVRNLTIMTLVIILIILMSVLKNISLIKILFYLIAVV